MKSLPPEALQALARFDSPTICNVIELFNYRPRNAGALSPRICALYPDLPPMVGYAVTATARSATAPLPTERPISLAVQVAAFDAVASPRVMVIADLDEPPLGAAYGEVMASTYQGFGCAGLVTDGFARDIVQVRDMRFPCFAAGTSVSHAYCRILSVNEPVTVGGVTIRPGDLLHGDANGVTTIPMEIAEMVAEAAEPFVAAENRLIAAARKRPLSLPAYEEALSVFIRSRDELSDRFAGKTAGRQAGL